MWRGVVHSAFIAGAALMLSACSFADSHAYLPGFMRIKAADPPPPEVAPDVKQMVSANLNSVFVATSYPHAVRVSPPLHDPRGPGWNACVRAELTNAVGKALGSGVYFTWKEIEIRGRPKPGVHLTGRTAAWAEKVGAGVIELSMTHSRELAAAVVVVADR